jgi:hypothetical protein
MRKPSEPRHIYDKRAVAQVDVDAAIIALNSAILKAHSLGMNVTLISQRESDRGYGDMKPALIVNARFEAPSNAELVKG